jgi:hypothetical protein
MRNDQKWKHKNEFLVSIEEKLRTLGEVEVPEGLEAKLLSSIGNMGEKTGRPSTVHWTFRPLDFGGMATAAIILFVLMLMISYGLPVPSQNMSAGLADFPSDYMTSDQNNGYASTVMPNNFKWHIPNQNEPAN